MLPKESCLSVLSRVAVLGDGRDGGGRSLDDVLEGDCGALAFSCLLATCYPPLSQSPSKGLEASENTDQNLYLSYL